MLRLDISLLGVSAVSLVACKSLQGISNSNLESGYSGNDCKTARLDLEYQSAKLTEIASTFDMRLAEIDVNSLPDNLKSLPLSRALYSKPADCSVLVSNPGTIEASSLKKDVFQVCQEYVNVSLLVQHRKTQVVSPDCVSGLDLKTTTPVFLAYCDSPCTFTNIDCAETALSYNSNTIRFACGTPSGALDAARGYCREQSIADTDCQPTTPVVKPGSSIGHVQDSVAGNNIDIVAVDIARNNGLFGSFSYMGGLAITVDASLRYNLLGHMELRVSNPNRGVYAGNFLSPDSVAKCWLRVDGYSLLSEHGFLGTGYAFQLAGNGASVVAGTDTEFRISYNEAKFIELGDITAAGVDRQVAQNRCLPLANAWIKATVPKQFSAIATELASAVADQKKNILASLQSLASAPTKADFSSGFGSKINCTTNRVREFNNSPVTIGIRTVGALVQNGSITLSFKYLKDYESTIRTSNVVSYVATGDRAISILKAIVGGGVGSLSIDDMTWLLSDFTYEGQSGTESDAHTVTCTGS